jgi:hypothetical protein
MADSTSTAPSSASAAPSIWRVPIYALPHKGNAHTDALSFPSPDAAEEDILRTITKEVRATNRTYSLSRAPRRSDRYHLLKHWP